METFFYCALSFNEYLKLRRITLINADNITAYFSKRFSALALKGCTDAIKAVYIYPEAAYFFKGLIIRAIILMNPHNPLAEIYTRKEMIVFLEFAKRYVYPIIISHCEVHPVRV